MHIFLKRSSTDLTYGFYNGSLYSRSLLPLLLFSTSKTPSFSNEEHFLSPIMHNDEDVYDSDSEVRRDAMQPYNIKERDMVHDTLNIIADGGIPTYLFLTGDNGKQGENSQLTILFHLYICHLSFALSVFPGSLGVVLRSPGGSANA